MFFLNLILTLGYFAVLIFAIVSITTSLFYLSELTEKHILKMKELIKYSIIIIIMIFIFLWIFEKFSFFLISFGILSHFLYYKLLENYPKFRFVSLNSFFAFLSIVLNHVFWFVYFALINYDLIHVFSFFIICVWWIPFLYFISLQSEDLLIPLKTPANEYDNPQIKFTRRNDGYDSSESQLNLKRRLSPNDFVLQNQRKNLKLIDFMTHAQPANLVFVLYRLFSQFKEHLESSSDNENSIN
ncbi:tex261 protein [Anaeramoeba ignava]|uniref:Tex261 protein n=1 Tax=Anaeramoeba ignava TaxID=1746090 RepID=A0A9Q0R4M5_ANAIG|nr:tex261 protein [Anaeramoeba ignava]